MLDYPARARACITENELNRLHIDLENALAPQELASLGDAIGNAELSPLGLAWLDRLSRLSPTVFSAPRTFAREPLHPNFTLYRGTGAPADKDVLLAFCGNAGRLMMPIPIFLQQLDPVRWDVLVARKLPGESYLLGLRGREGGPPSIVETAEELAGLSRYRTVAVFGTSGGGYTAIVTALLLDAALGVAVGGAPPMEGQPDYRVPEGAGRKTRLRYVFAGGVPKDAAGAAALAARYPGELVAIPGIAKHNVLAFLLMCGEADQMLAAIGLG